MKRMKMLPVLAGLLVCSALLFTTCGKIQEVLDKWTADASEPGVYVGVFSYDGSTYTDLVKKQQDANSESVIISAANKSLAYLNADNNSNIQNAVLNNYVQGDTTGRLLYYAISKVIDNLRDRQNALQNALDNVTIVSFTRGYDQGSEDMPRDSIDGATLHTKIAETTIKTKPINAYSVILSADADPSDQIKRTAQYVTSGDALWDDNPFIIRAPNLTLNTLQPIFEGIATGLPGIQTRQSVTITINGPGSVKEETDGGVIIKDSDGANFCAVFNDKAPTDSAAVYIKGFVLKNPDNNKYEISAITYKGVTGEPPVVVQASNQKGTRFEFNFPGVQGDFSSIKQYKYVGGSTVWDPLVGADTSSDVTVIKGEKKTAVVVLILDASLQNEDDINSVRSAAKAFVNKLYEQSQK